MSEDFLMSLFAKVFFGLKTTWQGFRATVVQCRSQGWEHLL